MIKSTNVDTATPTAGLDHPETRSAKVATVGRAKRNPLAVPQTAAARTAPHGRKDVNAMLVSEPQKPTAQVAGHSKLRFSEPGSDPTDTPDSSPPKGIPLTKRQRALHKEQEHEEAEVSKPIKRAVSELVSI